MKLPNGIGGVSKLPGRRRRPWRARKTIGWRFIGPDGKECAAEDAVSVRQVFQNVGYFATRKEAVAALLSGSTEEKEILFTDLYSRWLEYRTADLSESTLKQYRSVRKRLAPLDGMPVRSLNVDFVDNFIRAIDSPVARHKTGALLRQVLEYGFKKGLLSDNLGAKMDSYVQPRPTIKRKLFTPEEVDALWNNPSPCAGAALIALYGGWRPAEVLALTPANINLEEQTITAGVKTSAGISRTVPIHSAVRGLVERLISGPVLFPFSYATYLRFMASIGHTPHDTRHTFASAAKNAGMDAAIRKRIMGHALNDVTESVYTHASAALFRAEIEKVQY